MYVKYRADRPIISINDSQDWTLPEVPAADYSDEIMENAKEFSDKAAIVISRTDHGWFNNGYWYKIYERFLYQ